MYDVDARNVIEALRSGIPSKRVGKYFSDARPGMMKEITKRIQDAADGKSSGMIITGKYGEGKTHLLNTCFNMAQESNMVVSYVSIGKESPMDKLPVIYGKIISNTYLPGRVQPGFMHVFENMTPGSPIVSDMLLYATRELETDKLYFLLKAFMETEDPDEKFVLKSDLEGDFVANSSLKKIYKRLFNETVHYNVNFVKSKHSIDYFRFMSQLFQNMGYDGWVILFDEAELIGRFGKKARQNAYRQLYNFMCPEQLDKPLKNTFCVAAFSASYVEDVIEGKHEIENLMELYPDDFEIGEAVISMIEKAPQLTPLTKDEIGQVIQGIIQFYKNAYNWTRDLPEEKIIEYGKSGGYLLRTRIRSVIEILDQLYQYGEAGNISIRNIDEGSFDEEVPDITEAE